jgi:hypothetical protein
MEVAIIVMVIMPQEAFGRNKVNVCLFSLPFAPAELILNLIKIDNMWAHSLPINTARGA